MPLIERLVGRDELRPALSELERLDLVVEERRRPAPEYRFRHGLVQEVAYARLVDARRRDLHRVVGEALEDLYQGASEEVCGVLAHHFTEAKDPGRAVPYLLRAGDAARRVNADTEAIEHYRRALRFLLETGNTAQARSTLLKIALTHHLAFDFARAGQAYEEAFALGPPPPPSRTGPTERVEVAWSRVRERVIPGFVYTSQSWDLTRHLYRGLLAVGREFEVVPDLAERFEVSPDGLEYRFQLRQEARWSDGAPVSASDFVLTWERMREEEADTAFLLDIVASAAALDEATVEIRLHEPRSYFLHLVAQPPFFAWPRHLEEQGADWRDALPRVGNGPFVLTALDESRAVLIANSEWCGSRGNIREVDAFWSEGEERLRDAWARGRFAAAPDVGIRLEADISDTVVDDVPWLGTGYHGFHANRPPFHDRRVRTAFAHAVDRSALPSERVNEPAGRGGLIPPAMPGHSHRVAPEYDPDAARRLLVEAGYDDARSLGPIEIAAMRSPLLSSVEGLSEWLVGQLTAFGVDVNVTWLTYEAMSGAIAEFAQAWVWGFNADYPDPVGLLEPLLETTPLYRDSEIEALVDRARSLSTQDERLQACRALERRWIGEKVALVPLEYFRSLLLRRPWVDGFWMHCLGSSTFGEVVVRPERRSTPRST